MYSEANTDTSQNTTSLKNPISRLAYTLAKISLRFNLFVNEFIELYKFHMVILAKKQNPKYSIVELSARTGLDRRYISDTLKNEELKRTNSKVRMVLKQMREVCKRKNTHFIAKHGIKDSFESICLQVSSGALSNSSVAMELLRLGEIVENDRKYEVVDLEGDSVDEVLKLSYATRKLLNEINKICVLNNTSTILKKGKKNSIEYIFKIIDFENISEDRVIFELIRLGNLKAMSESYELVNWRFLSEKNEGYLILISDEICRLSNTIIENNNLSQDSKKLHRVFYTSQIHPRSFTTVNMHIKEYFHEIRKELYRIFISLEDDVPRGTYPTYGVSMFSFGPDHNIDYSVDGINLNKSTELH